MATLTGNLVEVARLGELADGAMKQATVDGQEVLLARVKDVYYVAQNRCPHMGGNLSQGTLQGTVVTCPRHASQFDLADGRAIRWTDWAGMKLALSKALRSPRPLRLYRVRVEGDRILVEV